MRNDEASPLYRRQGEAHAYQALVTCYRCSRRRRGREPANHSPWRRVLVSNNRAATLRCICGRWKAEVLAYGVAAMRVEEFEDALHAHVALSIALSALCACVQTCYLACIVHTSPCIRDPAPVWHQLACMHGMHVLCHLPSATHTYSPSYTIHSSQLPCPYA
jgi:hypothetical protein